MSKEPVISVIIPAYNAELFIAKAIQCMLNQTYSYVEILIADDASTDNTRNIIDSFIDIRIKKFHNSENLGYLKTCNKLFSKASGEYITFQDADDVSVENRLEIQMNEFLKDPKLGLCTSNCKLVKKTGKLISIRNEMVDYEKFKYDFHYNPLICCATIMLKKSVLDNVGYYHPFFDRLGAEDYEWLFRIIVKYKAIHLRDVLYLYTIHHSAVRINNTDRKKYYIHDIIQFIREQYILKGINILEEINKKILNQKLEELDKSFQDDSSKIIRIEAYSSYKEHEYWQFIKGVFKALKKNPTEIENYKIIPICTYITIRSWFNKIYINNVQ
jgi:glycosyltransferase involved in cell wall biosynthesis